MGCSEQQHYPLQLEVQLLGGLVLAGELRSCGAITKCSVLRAGRLEEWWEQRASAAPPEVDLDLQSEKLGEVPVTQVSDGHSFALRLHFCWDWKKPERLSRW